MNEFCIVQNNCLYLQIHPIIDIDSIAINQIAVYHTLLEAYNVMSHLSSEQIKLKWTIIEKKYALRSITNKDLREA